MRWRTGAAVKLPRDWLKELELLVWRFAHLGIGPDLAGMTTSELAALYAYLARLAKAAGSQ
jgi:hypothetical protein